MEIIILREINQTVFPHNETRHNLRLDFNEMHYKYLFVRMGNAIDNHDLIQQQQLKQFLCDLSIFTLEKIFKNTYFRISFIRAIQSGGK